MSNAFTGYNLAALELFAKHLSDVEKRSLNVAYLQNLLSRLSSYGDEYKIVVSGVLTKLDEALRISETFDALEAPVEHYSALVEENNSVRGMEVTYQAKLRDPSYALKTDSEKKALREQHESAVLATRSLLGHLCHLRSPSLYGNFLRDMDNLILRSDVQDGGVKEKIKDRVKFLIAKEGIKKFRDVLMVYKGHKALEQIRTLGFPDLANFQSVKSSNRIITIVNGVIKVGNESLSP